MSIAGAALGRADGWRQTTVYGAAHFGKSLFWYGGEVLFAYYLTDVAGLASAAMGLVLGLGFLVSAAMDLAIGRGFGSRMTDARGAGALQAAGSLAAGAALVAFFATAWLPPDLRIAWALGSGMLFRLGFALYDVPQNALMTLAAASGEDRSRVAMARISATGLAMLTVAGAVGPLLAAQRVGAGASFLTAAALCAAVIAILTAFGLRRALDAHPTMPGPPLLEPAPAAGLALQRLWPMFAMMAAMMLGPPLFQKLEPYFAARTLGSATWGGAVILAAALGVLCGQPVWLRFAALGDRLALFLVGAALQASGALIFLAGPLAWPVVLVVGAWLFGLGNGALGAAKWGAFSDQVARHAPGREGFCFAVFSATAKLSLAAGAVVVAATVGAAEADPPKLRWAMAAGPVLGSALMAVLALVMARRSITARSGVQVGP